MPEPVRGQLTVRLVSDIREVLDLALEPATATPSRHKFHLMVTFIPFFGLMVAFIPKNALMATIRFCCRAHTVRRR